MSKKDDKPWVARNAGSSTEHDDNDLSIFTTLVEVSYAADGTPSVAPAICFAPENNEVLWRGSPGEFRPFRIVFASGNPSDAGEPTDPLALDSRLERERQTGRFKARKAVGGDRQFPYIIEANGIAVDAELVLDKVAEAPAIIVEP